MYDRIHKSYTQSHPHPADAVFPLLSPEAEEKWLQHWQYAYQYSKSGQIETHAVFSTPHHAAATDTIWYTVRYYPKERYVEFVRVTPEEHVAHIELRVVAKDGHTSETLVSYSFTPLTDEGEKRLLNEIIPYFNQQMKGWEQAINHYLHTGSMLTT